MAGVNDLILPGGWRHDQQGRRILRAITEDTALSGEIVRVGDRVRGADGVEEVALEGVATSAAVTALEGRTTSLEGDSTALKAVNVVVAAPTGIPATDLASYQAAKATVDAAGGGKIVFRPGSYDIAFGLGGRLLIPNNCTVVVPAGTVVRGSANSAATADAWVLFAPAAASPVGVHLRVNGTVDGNRRNGNHGLSENIHGITLSDAVDSSVTGTGKFYNFRGEGVLVGHTGGGVGTANIPKRVNVIGPTFQDCGVMEVGDSGNPRMGVAYIAGTDCTVANCHFDTIGGYAIDLEGDYANDHFTGMEIGKGCTYRNVGQGAINVTTPGTISASCRVHPGHISGPSSTATTTSGSPNLTLVTNTADWTNGCAVVGVGIPAGARILSGAGTATMVMTANATASNAGVAIDGVPAVNVSVVPTNRARVQRKIYTGGDLTVNTTTYNDLHTALRIVMPAQTDDLIEFGVSGMWGSEAIFAQLDVAIRPVAATATTTSGSPNLTLVSNTDGWFNGQSVSGAGIPPGTTIVSGAGTATMVMSANATASAAGVLLAGASHWVGSDGGLIPGMVLAWRGWNGVAGGIGGSVIVPLVSSDIVGGLATFQLRGSTNGGARTLYASGADTPLVFWAKNLGPGW